MVTESYMLARAAPPSRLRTGFNQRAIPRLIDAAAAVERVLEHVAVAARQAPFVCVGAAIGGGWVAARLVSARRAERRHHRVLR